MNTLIELQDIDVTAIKKETTIARGMAREKTALFFTTRVVSEI